MIGGFFYIVAPLVLALVFSGLWLSAKAALETYRVGRVSSQIIATVARARDMRIPAEAQPGKTQAALMERLERFDEIPLMTDPEIGPGIESPWGRYIRVQLYPSSRAIRLEIPLSSAACRKVLLFYAKDAVSLGLQRVDMRDHLPSALWRLVYEQPGEGASGGIPAAAIQEGCGRASKTVVSLTFGL